MPQKNILFITSDQQRWDAIGAVNSRIKTPHLDRLFREGIAVQRAYTANPVCTPSRCSLLTGHYPSKHGCYTIGTNLPEDYPTIPMEFNRAGYKTALLGKAHFQSCLDPDSFEAAPAIMDTEFYDRWRGPYFGFQKAKLVIGHTEEQHVTGMHYGKWLKDNGVDTDRYFGNNPYTNYGVWELPEEYHPSKWIADETIETIHEAVAEDKPFFIWSSFQDPHNPCVVPEPWASMYDPADMPVYGLDDGEMDDKPPFYHSLANEGRLDAPLGDKPWYCITDTKSLGMDEAEQRRIMAMYYGMVSLMDHHIGRIVDTLEERGLLDDTLIVFTSDHGEYMGNHGLWWKGLPAYDDAQKVPFIVRDPTCTTPGQFSSSFLSLVDMGTTFLRYAGLSVPAGQQGVDQTPLFADATASCRDWVQVEFRPSESDYMQRTLVHGDYKAVMYQGAEYGELYNLREDPEQKHNLWDQPAYREVQYRMLTKMVRVEMEKDGVLRPRTAPA